jgi:hypothetical protein
LAPLVELTMAQVMKLLGPCFYSPLLSFDFSLCINRLLSILAATHFLQSPSKPKLLYVYFQHICVFASACKIHIALSPLAPMVYGDSMITIFLVSFLVLPNSWVGAIYCVLYSFTEYLLQTKRKPLLPQFYACRTPGAQTRHANTYTSLKSRVYSSSSRVHSTSTQPSFIPSQVVFRAGLKSGAD